MKFSARLAKTWVFAVVLSAAACVSNGALAQGAIGGSAVGADAWSDGLATSAQWPTTTTYGVAGWWTHGELEAGGRDFLNNPQSNGLTVHGQKSLSDYYQYSDIRPGAFGNFDMAWGTRDGLYQIEIGGVNVGYEDQSYFLNYSKAGEQYFNFIWDQTPHVYSTNALSAFVVNGNRVTLRSGIPTGLTTPAGLAPYAVPVDIGIRRDTAAASYRWTPGDDWDFNLDYSYMSRTGTQPSAVAYGGVLTSPTQTLKPVDDSTQNYDANGEHVGTSPWGQRYVFSLGYSGSQYQDSYNNYFVQGNYPGATAKTATVSNWPSNQANAFSANLSADLPWQSRYVGTFSYSMMTQNASFPLTNSAGASSYLPSGAPNLDGDINTLLINNVLTTKITSDLTAKTTFRFYDYKNNTPELGVDFAASTPCFAGVTVNCGNDYTNSTLNAVVNAYAIAMGYIKTNAGETLNWRPSQYWNIGAAYGFERYDWRRADVNATNENSGKVFVDYKPFSWLTSRASGEFAVRSYENYNYCQYVATFQWDVACPAPGAPGPAAGNQAYMYSTTQQQLMYDNRQLWKANYSLDVAAFRGVTITPWTKYQDASYSINPLFQQGMKDSKSWNFGVDGAWVVNPNLSLMAGYSRMYGTQLEIGSNANGPDLTGAPVASPCVEGATNYAPACQSITNETNVVDTFVAAAKYVAIPNKLDIELRYTASHGTDNMNLLAPGGFPAGESQFPENKVWFQRLDATAVYKFNSQQVAALGWKGDLKAKLNYAWESNSETNWANDPLSPTSTAYLNYIWTGWYNPNYNVHIISASLIASW